MSKNYRTQLVLLVLAALVLLPAVAVVSWHGSNEAVERSRRSRMEECIRAESLKGGSYAQVLDRCTVQVRVAH